MQAVELGGWHKPAAAPVATVSEVTEREDFVALKDEWNTLVRASNDHFFYRHEFIQIWLDHFAPQSRLRVLLGRDAAGTLVAALPLLEESASICGVTVRQLSGTSNAHSCRFDFLALDPPAAARALLSYLGADERWDVLRLVDVPKTGAAMALLEAAAALDMPYGSWDSQRSPYLALPTTIEAFEEALGKRFRASLRRRRRRLSELGKVEVERVEGGGELAKKLAEGFEVERSGWKGKNGTAIVQSPQTHGFYSTLGYFSAAGGYLSAYFLRLDGRAVAFDFAVTYGQRYLTLKPAYDEAHHMVSPGQLLTEDSLRACIQAGVTELDFLGNATPCKLDWTQTVRPHAWLYLFRGTPKGRMLCSAKFSLLPAAKRLLKGG
ncbi:MAG: GNAT family N-acetyltransferase [Myxococcota bacterium]